MVEKHRKAPRTSAEAFQRGQQDGRIKSFRDRILRNVLIAGATLIAVWLGTTWYWRIAIFALIMFLIGIAFSLYHRSKEA